MDDAPRARRHLALVALVAGALVLTGSGCTSVSKTATPTAALASPAWLERVAEHNFQACGLQLGDLASLTHYDPGRLTPFTDAINKLGEGKNGWPLLDLCFDRDVWPGSERDPVETIYFALFQGGETADVRLGTFQLNGSEKIRLSDPLHLGPNDPAWSDDLELEKHYTSSADVLPTLRLILSDSSPLYAVNPISLHQETFTWGPNDVALHKTFECSAGKIAVNGSLVAVPDTCKGKID